MTYLGDTAVIFQLDENEYFIYRGPWLQYDLKTQRKELKEKLKALKITYNMNEICMLYM